MPLLQKIIEDAQQQWMDIEGVIAIGQGKSNGLDCILVHVIEHSPQIQNAIPESFRDIPVVIESTGGPVQAH